MGDTPNVLPTGALLQAANARAAKATELLHEMLAKDAIDAQQAASDDPEVQQEFKTAQVSAQLAEALEATELQLSTAHAKTVRREDELAVVSTCRAFSRADLYNDATRCIMVTVGQDGSLARATKGGYCRGMVDQRVVPTCASLFPKSCLAIILSDLLLWWCDVQNMLRTVGNAASSVEKALIKADSLKAATVVTAAKARAIKDFCELQKTLQSSQSVRESLMDQVGVRSWPQSANWNLH